MGVTIAIDCMGGDHGPVVTVPAALEFLRSHPQASAILVGREEAIAPLLGNATTEFGARIRVRAASEVVAMDDPPAIAMRNKKDSSMRVAVDLVKAGEASAAVSAGNTGALMAISRFVLKTLPGIDRPAIATVLPSMKGHTYVLDLGANVDCSAEHLLQFGVMGAMLVAAIEHKDRPTVGLLNIGEEVIKGNDVVKEAGEASAAVSAGNTGALMAISRFVLKTLPGIDRPAIATVLPSMKGHTYVLDLGANVDCSAEHLLQFGVMGAMLVAAIEHKDRPTVGLLNIGEEVIKGNDVVKEAGELLRNSGLNFQGNVEGNDIYEGTVDVVVCDGFVGNVALKTSEGLAQMVGAFLKQEFKRTLFTKLLAVAAMPVLKRFKKRVDHRLYNGAPLLGLRGVVLKSHGSADVLAFGNALSRAAEAASNRLIERISERMASMNEAKA